MKYFTIEELTASSTARLRGIANIPSEEHKDNLEVLINNVLDKVREWYGKPITVTSGYRSFNLNNAINGSKTSQHSKGQAADIVGQSSVDNASLFNYIKNNLAFDQLIWEKGDDLNPAWVHVSFSPNNRKQVLKTKDGKSYQLFA